MSYRNVKLLAASFVALSTMAGAQPISGLYVGAGLGVNFLQDTDVTGTFRQDRIRLIGESNSFETGYVGVLSLGWGFGNGLRVEIEGSYRRNDADGHTLTDRSRQPAVGTASSYGGMANVLFDFDLGGIPWNLKPYLGAGLGYIWHSYDDVGYRASATLENTYNSSSGAPGAFAAQAIAGVALPISSVPGLALSAEYRFLGTNGHNFDRNRVNGATFPADADVDNFNHSILLGLRYAFSAPRAAPTPAATPVAAARTFLVFFDWSSADLTDRARQIIGEAATARGTGVTRIEVNGFTDRSGPPDYNLRLSVRRADAVAAELVRRGVPRNEIVTRGFGEENNLVPTADGVREPQNRRVEIILR